MQVLERSSGVALLFLLVVIVMSIYVGIIREGQERVESMTMGMIYDVEEAIDFNSLGIDKGGSK